MDSSHGGIIASFIIYNFRRVLWKWTLKLGQAERNHSRMVLSYLTPIIHLTVTRVKLHKLSLYWIPIGWIIDRAFICSDFSPYYILRTQACTSEHQSNILYYKGLNDTVAYAFIPCIFSPNDNRDLIYHA